MYSFMFLPGREREREREKERKKSLALLCFALPSSFPSSSTTDFSLSNGERDDLESSLLLHMTAFGALCRLETVAKRESAFHYYFTFTLPIPNSNVLYI